MGLPQRKLEGIGVGVGELRTGRLVAGGRNSYEIRYGE
jgi:hypothetical protein